MPRNRQRSVQSLDSVPAEIGDAPRSVPTLAGRNPTPSPLNSLGHNTPNPPPPTTDLGELIAPEGSTGMPMGPGPGNPMFDGPHNMNSMPPISTFSRPHMGHGGPPNMNMGPMGHPNNMGHGGPPNSMNQNHMGGPPNSMNHMGPGGMPPNSLNHMGPGGPPNSMNHMGPGGPLQSMNHMGPGGPPPNSMAAMMAMGYGPKGGPSPMHPGPPGGGKIYPANQPMVFNPSNPNAPPIYPCGYCHKEVHDNDQAILCESGCNFWFHRPCTGLSEPAYLMLTKEVYAEWACDKCLQTKSIPLVKLKP